MNDQRVCLADGCKQILSRYNRYPICGSCYETKKPQKVYVQFLRDLDDPLKYKVYVEIFPEPTTTGEIFYIIEETTDVVTYVGLKILSDLNYYEPPARLNELSIDGMSLLASDEVPMIVLRALKKMQQQGIDLNEMISKF